MTKRWFLIGLSIFLNAPLARAGDAYGVALVKLDYPSGNETVSGLISHLNYRLPHPPKKHPALVVIHEWWGQNEWIKNKALELADQGYITLVVDLYRGKIADEPDLAHQLARGLPQDRALRDLRAAIDALAKQPDVDPNRIGVIGWCMGGGLATELASADPRLKAAVVYYGSLPTDEKSIARIKMPFLGNYGADDKGISPSDVHAFESALKKQGTPVDIKIYPGAGHAFASSKDPKVFRTEAAADADARTKAFLTKTLAPAR